jgi:hypothetical protein
LNNGKDGVSFIGIEKTVGQWFSETAFDKSTDSSFGPTHVQKLTKSRVKTH